jgi:hypothetical protein
MNELSAGGAFARKHLAAITASRSTTTEKLTAIAAAMFPAAERPAAPLGGVTGYALVHHVLEGLRESAAHKDAETAKQVFAALVEAPRTDIVAASHHDAVTLTGVGSEMPLWAVSARSIVTATDDLTELLGIGTRTANRAGYGWLVDNALGVVIGLHRRGLAETASSWTVNRLPCTIYTDYYEDGEILGKELVHEAAHSWLNDCFTLTGEPDNTRAEFWSPWKQRNRTAFGMAHSAFAFSCAVNYLSWLLDHTATPAVAEFCERVLPGERARLREAAPGVEQVFTSIVDDSVREMLRAEFGQATGLGR